MLILTELAPAGMKGDYHVVRAVCRTCRLVGMVVSVFCLFVFKNNSVMCVVCVVGLIKLNNPVCIIQ